MSQKSRYWLPVGALLAGLGVGLGAMAAHGLEKRLSTEQLAWWDTAARYHMLHALALCVVGLVPSGRGRVLSAAGWLFATGVLLFSGSLYALALTGEGKLGAITPFGGVSFIAGWILLAIGTWAPAQASADDAT